jgi:hypothetical protein
MTYLLKSFQDVKLEKVTKEVNAFVNSHAMKGKTLDGWAMNTVHIIHADTIEKLGGSIMYSIVLSYFDENEEGFHVEKGVGYQG